VEYKCGTCSSINKTNYGNLIKPTRTEFCKKCANRKLNFDKIREDLDKIGYILILEEGEVYKNNKQKINVVCKCGNKKKCMAFADIKKSARCPNC
jgi:DNA-directed RNA polymerase subunit RPC12/RpoP